MQLPKNEPIIVFDYFVSCVLQISPSGILVNAQQQHNQVQMIPFSTIIRHPGAPLSYETFNWLNNFMIQVFKQRNQGVNITGVLIQNLTPLGTFEIPNATMFSKEELEGKTFITPESKIIFKDDNDVKKDS